MASKEISERWSELSKTQVEILKLIIKNPRISRKEISEKLDINQSAIKEF